MFIMIRERERVAGPGIIVSSSVRPVTFAVAKLICSSFLGFWPRTFFRWKERRKKISGAERASSSLVVGGVAALPDAPPPSPLAALETVAKGNWRERGKLWMRLLQPLADCQFHSRRRPRSIVSHSLLSLLSLSLLFLFISPLWHLNSREE